MENLLNDKCIFIENLKAKLLAFESRIKILENNADVCESISNTIVTNEQVKENEYKFNDDTDTYKNDEHFPTNISQLDGNIQVGGTNGGLQLGAANECLHFKTVDADLYPDYAYFLNVLYSCDNCDLKSTSKDSLMKHVMKKHNSEKKVNRKKHKPKK